MDQNSTASSILFFFFLRRMSSKDRTKCEFPRVDVGNFTLTAMFIDKAAYLCTVRPYFRETQIGLKSLQMFATQGIFL